MTRAILAFVGSLILCVSLSALAQTKAVLQNHQLTVRMRASDGAYEILSHEIQQPVLISRVGAEINHQWVSSSDYPHHETTETTFQDALGSGHLFTITFSGLANKPDMVCLLRLYQDEPYGSVSVEVENTTNGSVTVQNIRDVDAVGKPAINLGASEKDDRVLAEIVSENPSAHIGSLAQAPHGDYFGVRDDLIYNLASKQGLLLAALTANRFLTVSNLRVSQGTAGRARIASFTMDSTGTTKAMLGRDPIAPDQQVMLSLPVAPGKSLSSERVMFAAGPNYFHLLENYGKAVRRLHHLHFTDRDDPMGWWSWTAFYSGINAGETMTNARWLATHLKSLGYKYFHIDEGYEYARGEYTTPNATHFPNGMWIVEHKICNLGLVPGIWTGPFQVSDRSWVYEHHKNWLVRDAHGKPICIGRVDDKYARLYVLDTTNPGAQKYLRKTYRILTRQWGLRYIKLDFMDNSAIEGYYYQPHTTALEAQRIGLRIIRQAVGKHVLLDKDGSVMLAPVGFVNEGRLAPDTGHSFIASKDAVTNIASRFYMNRNFYVSDPDAFSVSKEVEPQQHWHNRKTPLTFHEAEVQIVLAAVTGGMYEIGDDLPTLGSEPKRLALVENQELIDMNRLGRAALPLDLMTFPASDEDPSVFFLREDPHQSMLAVFNWTEHPTSHTFTMDGLGLPAAHSYRAFDVLNHDAKVTMDGHVLKITDQAPHSVRLIKLVDESVPARPPEVTAHAPTTGRTGHALELTATAAGSPVPAVSYHWDFGDGTHENGRNISHTYTHTGTYTVNLTIRGIDGLAAHKHFAITVSGILTTQFDLSKNRRYKSPSGH